MVSSEQKYELEVKYYCGKCEEFFVRRGPPNINQKHHCNEFAIIEEIKEKK